eukprot:189855-Hanusia_phi.AAC.1
MSNRYKRLDDEDDEKDEDGEAELAAALLAPPSICIAFSLPDEDSVLDESELEKSKEQREDMMKKLRKLNLEVEQRINRAGDKLFLNVSTPDHLMSQQAQARGIRLRLQDKHGGALCMFSKKLVEGPQGKDRFLEPADKAIGHFSSLQQLEITDRIIRSEPINDGSGPQTSRAIDPESLMEGDNPVIIGYFYMHFDRARYKLVADWAGSWTSPQPIEDIQVYFGEKVRRRGNGWEGLAGMDRGREEARVSDETSSGGSFLHLLRLHHLDGMASCSLRHSLDLVANRVA